MSDPQFSETDPTLQQGSWSQTQLLSLADSDHHKRSSRQFAALKRWRNLSRSGGYIWADFVARGVTVRTTLCLSPLRFNCDCSQRSAPCFHGLGLALLYAEQPELFAPSEAEAPEFSTDLSTGFSYTAPLSVEAQRKRYAELMTGLAALELWCHDLIRDGLESADSRPKSTFTQISDRLVDARAPKLARDVRAWSKPFGQDWHAALLADLGEWQLVIQGFKRLHDLPEAVQADLKLRVGWLPEVRENIWDAWQVLGRRTVLTQGKRQQRVWLWGQHSKRTALLVHAPAEKMQRETSFLTGATVRAELSFFASTTPLRAELKTWQGYEAAVTEKPFASSVAQASQTVSATLAKNPWHTLHPLVLSGISFELANDAWFIRDAAGYALPLSPSRHIWQLIALARGGNLTLFGEWNERTFRPLSIWQADGLLDLRVLRGRK